MTPKRILGSSKNDNKTSNYIKSNLKFLRESHGKTLEQMSQELGLSGKSAYRAYEQGEAVPAIHILLKLASFFDVSLDELVRVDLTQTQKSDIAIRSVEPQVAVVPIKARAGYVSGFEDGAFFDGLRKITIPFKPYGIARAFEIEGDSMLPDVTNGSYVVGIKINPNDFQQGKNYVVVTTEGDVLYKTVWKIDDKLELVSSNNKYRVQKIEPESVREMWKYFCHLDQNKDSK
jgi:transcriptional regulator with XRE-family HTH domain